MKLVAIVGSAVHSGKTRKAVEVVVRAAAEQSPHPEVDIVDLSETRVSILDGRPLDQYDDDTAAVLARIASGNLFLLASPIYRGTYTGALKNLLDHVPLEVLEGKVVGLLATGASPHHYLAIDHQFRGLLAWFNAYVLPGSVYLDHAAYSGGELVDPDSLRFLKQLGQSMVTVASRLEGVGAAPPSLSRQMMKPRTT